MDLIILQNGLYYLVEVTPELLIGEVWEDCFDLCQIIKKKITIYSSEINKYILKDGSFFYGCMCK